MPPPLPKEESASEDEASDSGSVHEGSVHEGSVHEAAPEEFDSLQLLRESAMGVEALHSAAHNSTKRAAEDDITNHHVAKYPRLDQGQQAPDEEESDDEEEESSSEEDESEDDEEDEEDQGSSYPPQSLAGRFVVSEGIPRWVSQPSADKYPLHPDLVGMTPVQLFQHALPHIRLPQHLAPIARHLAQRPIVRMPVLEKPFQDTKANNFSAYFMQATEHMVPDEQACLRCTGAKIRKRYVGGAFVGCVVFADPEEAKLTGGACANCWYGRQGSLCSFRNPAGHVKPKRPKNDPISLPSNHYPSLMSPPPPSEGQQMMGQVHPAFLASVSTATPSYTPMSEYPHIDNQIAHQRNRGETPTLPGPDGNVDKVKAWEAKYRKKSTFQLKAVYQNLADWQEDLTTRLVAMNKVLLERLEKKDIERNKVTGP
ncbi:hypothetical protein B0T20DRAFT_504197 [Sordaria brevicollis]|uniref:Uncharacterized protein n=1 Tax=Sordaria brevicollis TaxID=83679 RepID=A0AAE0PKT7_SORBR|nr:hypothetical protein B0T20DRAFT_504197 [Sordaria brevicollis]